MARVVFGSGLQRHTGGTPEVEVEAGRVRELLEALHERFPALRGRLDQMSVAIDGEIHSDARFQKLGPDSEVHFVPRIAGG